MSCQSYYGKKIEEPVINVLLVAVLMNTPFVNFFINECSGAPS